MREPGLDVACWLPQARAGSREALGQVLEAYRAYLLLIANRELDPELQAKGGASDLVQQTFLEAQQAFPRFYGDSALELQAWLRQLLLHNVANFARHYRETNKRQLNREEPLQPETPSGAGDRGLAADTPSPSGKAMANEQAQDLERALERLPEDYRQVITWRYRDGCSFEEIAQRLQRSDNAVRKLWFRAIERLQEELGQSK
jgi:RNA polymerase sigma-70 factor (ECF subfamily)